MLIKYMLPRNTLGNNIQCNAFGIRLGGLRRRACVAYATLPTAKLLHHRSLLIDLFAETTNYSTKIFE